MSICAIAEIFAQSIPNAAVPEIQDAVKSEQFLADSLLFDSIVSKEIETQRVLRDLMYMEVPPE